MPADRIMRHPVVTLVSQTVVGDVPNYLDSDLPVVRDWWPKPEETASWPCNSQENPAERRPGGLGCRGSDMRQRFKSAEAELAAEAKAGGTKAKTTPSRRRPGGGHSPPAR
jgi:hypothetical protein